MNKKLINHCQEMSVDSFVAVLELGNFEYAKVSTIYQDLIILANCQILKTCLI